jgi:hypothetical protein
MPSLVILHDRKEIRRMKREAIARIQKLIAPHLYESGWIDSKITGPHDRYLRVARIMKGDSTRGKLIYAMTFDRIYAITPYGPITDIHMAAVVSYWETMPLEDILCVEDFLDTFFC